MAEPDDPIFTLAAAVPGAVAVRAAAGDVLFRPEDPCRGFIALRSGAIRVSVTSPGGRELILYRVRPGEICLQTFACLAQGRLYAAEGIAESPVEAALLPPPAFDRIMAEDAPFRSAVLGSVANRFADLEGVVQALAFTGLPARLAGVLIARSDADGALHITHEALAAEIGSAREAVSRQLAVFAREGLVALSRGQIRILAPDALTRISHEA